MLNLYHLKKKDITELEQEAKQLQTEIANYQAILNSEKKLYQTIKKDLRQMKKKYADDRRTSIEEEIDELKINIEVLIASEDVLVSVTKEGYVKRTSLRSYSASNGEDFAMKDKDHLVSLIEMNTTDKILVFTNKGRYLCIPVHELPDIRWKDIGQHISNLSSVDSDEFIVKCFPVREFVDHEYLIFFTKSGMIKRSKMSLYDAKRFTRPLIAINLRENDEVVNVSKTDGNSDIFVASNTGYGLWFEESAVSVVGQRALGVISIQLNDDEYVVSGHTFDQSSNPSVLIVTQRGACKRMMLKEVDKSSRANRGTVMLRKLKGKPHRIKGFFLIHEDDTISFKTSKDKSHSIFPLEITTSNLHSNGSFVIDEDNDGEVTEVWQDVTYSRPFSEEN